MSQSFAGSPPSPYDSQLGFLILEHATDYAIFTLDRDGTITGWSPGARHVLGYEVDEAIGMNFAALFADSDVAAGAPQQEVEKTFLQGRAEDTRWHVRKSG